MLKNKINKDREHWKKVLLRIIVVIKILGKSNLALPGKKLRRSAMKVIETNWEKKTLG